MNIENTAIRLKKIMELKKLKQVDLLDIVKPYCNKYNVKMNKSDISQYLSGKTKPNQDKLVILSMALKVNESWLMGYDVPMDRVTKVNNLGVTQEELTLLNNYNQLNDIGKKEANKRVSELTEIPKYTRDTFKEPITIAAHDDNLTDNEKDEMSRRIEEFEKNLNK